MRIIAKFYNTTPLASTKDLMKAKFYKKKHYNEDA